MDDIKSEILENGTFAQDLFLDSAQNVPSVRRHSPDSNAGKKKKTKKETAENEIEKMRFFYIS